MSSLYGVTAFRDGLRAQTQRELGKGAPLRSKEAVEKVWAPDLDALQGTLLGRLSKDVQHGEDRRVNPELLGGILYLIWLGNNSMLRMLLGRETSEISCLGFYSCGHMEQNGWMFLECMHADMGLRFYHQRCCYCLSLWLKFYPHVSRFTFHHLPLSVILPFSIHAEVL